MMDIQSLTYLFVGISFGLYIFIAIKSRAGSTNEFYIAGKGVHPVANGMATAADWMSAASFISMAGLISFMGRDGAVYLMGWTGGYVLLALLLAPYLRKFGQYTVPDFIGTRYYSTTARVVAVICLIIVSFTYVAGQMRGVGIVFSRFLEVEIETGVIIGMGIVFFYAVLGGMKGITYTQVAQYCVLIFAYLVPAIFISILITGNPIPQFGFGDRLIDQEIYLLEKLDLIMTDIGFQPYTSGLKETIDVFCITAALMLGTAGLPHVIVRFFTVPDVASARKSAGYALIFIAILYKTAPAVSSFARYNLFEATHNVSYQQAPEWFKNWEDIGLIAWRDKNNDGLIQHAPGNAFDPVKPKYLDNNGESGERVIVNDSQVSSKNEVYIDRDIMVLANPEIAGLPPWVIALVAAGALAAALSTAAGLLLVISASVSHDLIKKTLATNISEKKELFYARFSVFIAVIIAGLFGIYPPGFVAQVVAFAFGLAAATLFPALLLGIFTKSINKEGAVSGMLIGLIFTLGYIVYFKFLNPEMNTSSNWLMGISPEGIGTIGMLINVFVSIMVSKFTSKPPSEIDDLIDSIRQP